MQQHLRHDEVNSAYDAHATKLKHVVDSLWREQAFSKNRQPLVAHASADAYAESIHQMWEHVPTEEYYYDEHPQLEDLLMEGSPHSRLVHS